jgi:hypothetical protein
MISQIKDFIKKHFSDIILFIIIVLLMMLSFAVGYLIAENQLKEPLQIEYKK